MSDQCYYIWSYKHDSWWRWNSRGYTTDIKQAGLYTEKDARKICDSANAYQPADKPHEEMRHVENYSRVESVRIIKNL